MYNKLSKKDEWDAQNPIPLTLETTNKIIRFKFNKQWNVFIVRSTNIDLKTLRIQINNKTAYVHRLKELKHLNVYSYYSELDTYLLQSQLQFQSNFSQK